MNLVLVGENKDLVVECLNDEFEFVHDKTDGSNWFNQKTLASMFGVSQQSISNKLKTYLKLIDGQNDQYKKNSIGLIKLKIENADKPVKFYNFKAVSYLAHRFNTVEALNMLEWIDSSLNTMFNVAVGKDSINSNKDWLKNQCEVKAFQAAKYKGASKLLYEGGLESDARKMWGKYKKLSAEALHYKELYVDYDKIDRIVANERNCKSEQLKLM